MGSVGKQTDDNGTGTLECLVIVLQSACNEVEVVTLIYRADKNIWTMSNYLGEVSTAEVQISEAHIPHKSSHITLS